MTAIPQTTTAALVLAEPVAGLTEFEKQAVIAFETPIIAQRIQADKANTERGIHAVLMAKIQVAMRVSGVGAKMDENERNLVAMDMLKVLNDFPSLRLGELSLVFDLGASGKFGDFLGHGMNARTLRGWINSYVKETRNELLTRQIESQNRKREEQEAIDAIASRRLHDLVVNDTLLGHFERAVKTRLNASGGVIEFSDVDPQINRGDLWYPQFKAKGILKRVLPIDNATMAATLDGEVERITALNRMRGIKQADDWTRHYARASCAERYFRQVIAQLINIGTTTAAFESMLIAEGIFTPDWREQLLTMGWETKTYA